jgi:amino acid adenylation domain-containing protein
MNLPAHLAKRVPMSSAQRRLYLQCQLPGGDRAYHLLYVARVLGPFRLDAAEAFAARMLARHETLRSAFRMDGGQFISEVHTQATLAITVMDGLEADLERVVEALDQPFSLDLPPLIRVAVLRLGAAESILICNCHHLIADGYSAGILAKDIANELSGRPLPPPERAYSDFVDWENRFFQSEAYARQRDFWCRQYPKAPKRLDFRPDFTPGATKSFAGDYFIRRLESKALKEFSRSQAATPFMTLLAAFYCVLFKLTNQDDITVGTLVSPRESGHFQNVIGLFANTLPLTQSLDADISFAVFLQQVRAMVFQAMQNADYPFEHLVAQLPFLEQGARNPLFDVVFNFERVVRGDGGSFGGVRLEPLDYYAKVSMFDFAVDLVEYEDHVRFKVEYATALFRRESLEGLMDAYCGIIEQVCRRPDIALGELSLLSREAQSRLARFNDTTRSLKKDRAFLDAWTTQAAQYADNPAARWQGGQVSYARLEERANRLAHHLADLRVTPGAVVALAMERSPDWLVALLAVWKAGAVYLPLDPAHPGQRLRHQLADSGAALVIAQDAASDSFAGFARVITPRTFEPALAACPAHAPARMPGAAHPAYIIYTSGSTGTPKGVLVDHQAVHAHLDAVKGIYRLRPDDNVLQFASPAFDASLEQILVTLSAGACLVFPDSPLMEPRSLLDMLLAEEITVAEFPPAYLRELVPALEPGCFRKIRRLISGGDVLTAGLAREIAKFLPAEAQFLNFYGPTEAAMAATAYRVPGDLAAFDPRLSLPIGKPLSNTRLYILDSAQRPLPIGVAGELCIAGDRLARGYLNLAELTEEKFVRLELQGTVERVYRTSDRARWLPDGTVEFLGRLDRQVQLRGIRIELGEIEQALHSHPEVREAVVIKHDGDRESLAAFVVARGQDAVDVRTLYGWLQDRLPDAMIPAAFTFLAALPRNALGKVDEPALTATADLSPLEAHETPLDPVEWDLWRIWRKILNVPRIGRRDVFFRIGGNSLSAIRVMVEVKNRYGLDLPLPLLLQSPTIAGLADFLRGSGQPAAPSPVVALNPEGTGPAIILIPGLGGNILDLYELSSHLDKRFPCHGLQLSWDGRDFAGSGSMEELAGFYLRELEAAVPLGRCILLGHSFGGYLAFELARLLARRDRPAQALVVLDVVAPAGKPAERRLALTERDLLALTVAGLTGGRGGFAGEIRDVPGEGEQAYASVLDFLKSAGLMPHGLAVGEFRRYIATVAARAAAFAAYEPRARIETDIRLYRARATDDTHGFAREDGGWAAFTAGSFSLHWTPGDHFTMIKGGHARDLAGLIQRQVLADEHGFQPRR